MFKLPITYIGFDGKEKTKDFYFNLTKADLMKIHMALPGGLDGFINKLDDDPDPEDVISVFEKLILTSYGKRTSSNAFIKSKEISQEFAATDAYSELFLKFLENEDGFVNKFLENVATAPPGTLEKILANKDNAEEEKLEAETEDGTPVVASIAPAEPESDLPKEL